MLDQPLNVDTTLNNWIARIEQAESFGQAIAFCCLFKDQFAKALIGGIVNFDQYHFFVQETERIIDLWEARFNLDQDPLEQHVF